MTRQQADNWKEGRPHALEQRKEAALSRLSARLAAGSDSERVAARLIMGDWEGGARVAAASQDGAAYRLALSACAGRLSSPAAPSCGRLSALTWAQLDPEDSGPWMRLFGDAMQKRDEAAATEAMEQVLMRRRRSPSRPLVLALNAARDGVDDAVGLGQVVVDVIGLEAAQPDSSHAGLSRYCGAKAVKDGARRARCERFARWQFEQADTVMDALVAVGVADRVGLPADQRPFTREQLNQGLQRLAGPSFSGDDCAGLARAAQWPTLLSQRNELQMALQPAGSP